MYFIDLSRIDNDIQYLERRFNWVIGGFVAAVLAYPYALRLLVPINRAEPLDPNWVIISIPFLMMLLAILATLIPSSRFSIVEWFIPSEIGAAVWQSIVWLYKRTLVAMWIILISSVIADTVTHFLLSPISDPMSGGYFPVGCIIGSANYLLRTIMQNKKTDSVDISARLGRLKWSCAVVALLFLIARFYPQVRDFLPEDMKEDQFAMMMYAGYFFMALGLVVSFLNPDFLWGWTVKNSGSTGYPDTPIGRKANRAMLSVIGMLFGPVFAFFVFLITGSMMHLNITVPVFIVMAFWIINRVELQDSYNIPMTARRKS